MRYDHKIGLVYFLIGVVSYMYANYIVNNFFFFVTFVFLAISLYWLVRQRLNGWHFLPKSRVPEFIKSSRIRDYPNVHPTTNLFWKKQNITYKYVDGDFYYRHD